MGCGGGENGNKIKIKKKTAIRGRSNCTVHATYFFVFLDGFVIYRGHE